MTESITKELREWVARHSVFNTVDGCADKTLLAIADRIDEKFEHAFDDDRLEEYGLLKLPVDADGKPWHIGDEMRMAQDWHSGTITVMQLRYSQSTGGTYWEVGTDGGCLMKADEVRHHKSTPSERIRKVAKTLQSLEVDEDEGSKVGFSAHKLFKIADELEGDGK